MSIVGIDLKITPEEGDPFITSLMEQLGYSVGIAPATVFIEEETEKEMLCFSRATKATFTREFFEPERIHVDKMTDETLSLLGHLVACAIPRDMRLRYLLNFQSYQITYLDDEKYEIQVIVRGVWDE